MSVDKEVAIGKSVEYFAGNTMAADIWVDKYALRDANGNLLESSPDDMHKRLTFAFHDIEQMHKNPMSEQEIWELFEDFRYVIPQGSPMAAIGDTHRLQSLSNCFVVASPEDSYGGICLADQELVQIMKRRGGVGMDISTIRPKGMPTSNAARTTDGIGVFMKRFSTSCREVAQGGRRGALMLTCNVHHPEIETFISAKRNTTDITGANISPLLTDEFMKAVVADTDYEQRWPVTGTPQITKMVSARKVWKLLINSAWGYGEPGALFIDTIHKGPADAYCPSVSTNPCQPSWATLLTPDGIRTMEEINIGDTIWSGSQWTKVVSKWCTGIKEVYSYETNSGVVYCTENHRVVSGGIKVEAKNANTIDAALGNQIGANTDKTAIIDGLLIGDGSYHKASGAVVLYVGKDDSDYHKTLELTPSKIGPTTHTIRGYSIGKDDLLHLPYRRVPTKYKRALPDQVCSFLCGLYSANGSVVSNRVTLKTSNKDLAFDVIEMLSSVGIHSYITTNKAKPVEFSNGTYTCKESYDVNIGRSADVKSFSKMIGFLQDYKMAKLAGITAKPKAAHKTEMKVVASSLVSTEEVFDITVECDSHTYWSGGLLVSNCGEIPLNPYDSCRLMAINTFSFVTQPFTGNAEFDWRKFSSVVIKSQRLMDDLVTLEANAVNKILAKIRDTDTESLEARRIEIRLWEKIRDAIFALRRTGLGMTAIADTMAALGMRYGSKQSVEFTEMLYKSLAKYSWISSIQMAKERGHFVKFNKAVDQNCQHTQKILAELPQEYRDMYEQYGRRNAACTTTAPTGTISNLALVSKDHWLYGTSSGIEPVFQLSYTRRKKITGTDGLSVDFVDQSGDKWHHYQVRHSAYSLAFENNQFGAYDHSLANEVKWLEGIAVQSAAQQWVDHAISRTANMPKTATEQDVEEVYLQAWRSGLKGVTVYRDGCRDGVLITDSQTEIEFKQHKAPKRPDSLKCDVYHVQINKEPWVVMVGLLNGKPYEVMAGTKEALGLTKHQVDSNDWTIRKNSRGKQSATYSLLDSKGDCIIADISTATGNPVHAAFSRTISLALRHGADVVYLVEQLIKGAQEDSSMQAYSKVVARVLKNYIPNNTKSTEKQCPQCSLSDLVFMEGCITCKSCGYSKCS